MSSLTVAPIRCSDACGFAWTPAILRKDFNLAALFPSGDADRGCVMRHRSRGRPCLRSLGIGGFERRLQPWIQPASVLADREILRPLRIFPSLFRSGLLMYDSGFGGLQACELPHMACFYVHHIHYQLELGRCLLADQADRPAGPFG